VSVGVRDGRSVRVGVAVLVGILVLVGSLDAVRVARGVFVGGEVGETGRLVLVAGACILAGVAADRMVDTKTTTSRKAVRFITSSGLDSRRSPRRIGGRAHKV
jgi:hypothetical protein